MPLILTLLIYCNLQVVDGYVKIIGLTAGSSSAWPERCVRDAEVAGSNPVSPISINPHKQMTYMGFFVCEKLIIELNVFVVTQNSRRIGKKNKNHVKKGESK